MVVFFSNTNVMIVKSTSIRDNKMGVSHFKKKKKKQICRHLLTK